MYHKIKAVASHRLEKITRVLTLRLEQEERTLFHWVPVFYGLGIALYFTFPFEPSLQSALIPLGLSILAYGVFRFTGHYWRSKIAMAFVLLCLGFTAIKVKTDHLQTPMLIGDIGFQKVEGTLKNLERLPNATRLVLEDVQFAKQLRQDLPIPTKIRVSLKGRLQPGPDIMPGDRVQLKASLTAPSLPVAPGAYDFRRRAYFEGIGAVGYGVTPVTRVRTQGQESFFHNLRHTITRLRGQLTTYIQVHITGQSGAVVAALVTGDRSALKDDTRQAFADAGIAHILAISGLHLSIVAGLIFFLIRGALSLSPTLALRHNTKKLAAAIALVFTFGYLILSGAPIPAERAFIMTSLILLAVMTDRVAFTLRNVSLAAFMVLLIMPEALMGPSFQLSFAAVIGLVVAYERLHPMMCRWHARTGESRFPTLNKLSLYLASLIFSSLIATLATAPFTIFTFNRFSLVAILTNLIAIPYVSFIIMPMIVFALLTAPLTMGFMGPLLEQVMSLLNVIAFKAQQLPGAVILVPQISSFVQILTVLGLLWLALWRTSWRFYGLVPLMIAFGIAHFQRPPDLYIPQDQNLVGYYDSTTHTAWVDTLQSGRFARRAWLQLIALPDATKFTDDKKNCVAYVPQDDTCFALIHTPNTLKITQTNETKWHKKIHSLTVALSQDLTLHPKDFKNKGAHFIWLEHDGTRLQTVRDISGYRPWNSLGKGD